MNLHSDRDAFKVLLSAISKRVDIREDILEKDYYVTLLLSELAEKQDTLPAYFKGGTALYKAIGEMKRFSEDIDLTVEVSDCTTPSQGQKRLKAATKGYLELRRATDRSGERDEKGSITTVYEYKPVVAVDTRDALQRFGSVKVEATSFTVSDPHEPLEIAPLLLLEATPDEQDLLSTRYGVSPFNIETMKIERIFADKVFAAEFYYQRHDLAQVAKHTYDLVVMMEQAKIKKMMSTPEEFIDMLNYKRREEVVRIGSDLSSKPFSEFAVLNSIANDREIGPEYQKMQRMYVFNDDNMVPFPEAVASMQDLRRCLLNLNRNTGTKQ
jgi:predicted nucleotidyltransferase component of viral defense system